MDASLAREMADMVSALTFRGWLKFMYKMPWPGGRGCVGGMAWGVTRCRERVRYRMY